MKTLLFRTFTFVLLSAPFATGSYQSLVGYRWYDNKQVPVAYPFGFGLSYAQFVYGDIEVQPTTEGSDVRFVLNIKAT